MNGAEFQGGTFLRSLKHQILMLLLGSLVVLAASFIIVFGWYMRERAVEAAIIKAKTDLATCTEIIELNAPGSWHLQEGTLYKGKVQIAHRTDLVDRLSELTGDTVTIFLGDTRVATTVRGANGERAIGTKVSDIVAQTVLKNGQVYLGEANVVGQLYQTAYEPLRGQNGDIIGMFYVGISKSYAQTLIVNSLLRMALFGLGLTLIVVLLTWFFIQRVIIRPLNDITRGTRDVATGHLTDKVDVSGPKEIGDLAVAFNQMVERLEGIADEMTRATTVKEKEKIGEEENENNFVHYVNQTIPPVNSEEPPALPVQGRGCIGEEGLPKGLNQVTLKQVVSFLNETHTPVSAEDVAEGVNLTRVTVRRYLEFLERCGVLTSELKYGTVGRPVKLFFPVQDLSTFH